MEKNVSQVTAQEETALKARGYNEDLLPSSRNNGQWARAIFLHYGWVRFIISRIMQQWAALFS